MSISGNITAASYFGDGSNLTGVQGGGGNGGGSSLFLMPSRVTVSTFNLPTSDFQIVSNAGSSTATWRGTTGTITAPQIFSSSNIFLSALYVSSTAIFYSSVTMMGPVISTFGFYGEESTFTAIMMGGTAAAGSASRPALVFGTRRDTGLYNSLVNGSLDYSFQGTQVFTWANNLTMQGSSRIQLPDGTLANPEIFFTNCSNCGLMLDSIGGDNIIFAGQNGESLRIGGAGPAVNRNAGYVAINAPGVFGASLNVSTLTDNGPIVWIVSGSTKILEIMRTSSTWVNPVYFSSQTVFNNIINLKGFGIANSTGLEIGNGAQLTAILSTNATVNDTQNSTMTAFINVINSTVSAISNSTSTLLTNLKSTATVLSTIQNAIATDTTSIAGRPFVITIYDEGSLQGNITTINCSGSPINCALSGSTLTVTVTAGGGGGGSSALYIEPYQVTISTIFFSRDDFGHFNSGSISTITVRTATGTFTGAQTSFSTWTFNANVVFSSWTVYNSSINVIGKWIPVFSSYSLLNVAGSTFNIAPTGQISLGTVPASSLLDIFNGSITIRGTNSGIQLGGVSFTNYMSTIATDINNRLLKSDFNISNATAMTKAVNHDVIFSTITLRQDAVGVDTTTLNSKSDTISNFSSTASAKDVAIYVALASNSVTNDVQNSSATSFYNSANSTMTNLSISTAALAATKTLVGFDEGSPTGGNVTAVNFVGSAVAATQSGSTVTVTVTASGGGSSDNLGSHTATTTVQMSNFPIIGASSETISMTGVPSNSSQTVFGVGPLNSTFTITSQGNVAIGTMTPTSKLHVEGGSITVTGANSGLQVGGVSYTTYMSTVSTDINNRLLKSDFNISNATAMTKAANQDLWRSTNDAAGDARNSTMTAIQASTTTMAAQIAALSVSSTIVFNQESPDISNRTYFLHNESTGTALNYLLMASSPSVDNEITRTQTIASANNIVRISSHITPSLDPGVTKLPAGVWSFTSWASASNITALTQLVITVSTCALDGTNMREVVSATETISDLNIDRLDSFVVQQNDIVMSTSDRIVVQYFGRTASAIGITVNLYYAGTTHASHLSTPIGGVYKFVQLTDAPSTLIGQGGKYVAVNDDQTSLVLVSTPTTDSNTTRNFLSTAGVQDANHNLWFSTNATVNDTQNSSMTAFVNAANSTMTALSSSTNTLKIAEDTTRNFLTTGTVKIDALYTALSTGAQTFGTGKLIVESSGNFKDVVTSSIGFIAPSASFTVVMVSTMICTSSATFNALNVSSFSVVAGTVVINGISMQFSSSAANGVDTIFHMKNGLVYFGGDATAIAGPGGGGSIASYNGSATAPLSTMSVITPFGLASVSNLSSFSTFTVLGATNPYETISIPAYSWIGVSPSSASPENGGFVIPSSGTPSYNVLPTVYHKFLAPNATASFIETEFDMDYHWDGSSIAFLVRAFKSTGTTASYGWSLGGIAYSSGTSLFTAQTSSVTVFTSFETSNTMVDSPQSAGYTLQGSPAPGAHVKLWLSAYGGKFDGFPKMSALVLFYRKAAWDGSLR